MKTRVRMGVAGLSRLLAAALVLNWFWEMTHMPAYAEMAGRSWAATAWRCLRASAGDAALTLLLSLAALRLGGGLPRVLAVAALVGAAAAVLIERTALGRGQWSYTEAMPVLPLLEVGLWPVLQLALLVPVALWFAVRRSPERRLEG